MGQGERLLPVALAGEFVGVAEASVHDRPGIAHDLGCDFVLRPDHGRAAHAGVNAAGVLPDDDEINVLRPLAFERRIHVGIQFDRTEVDVLIQFEPKAEGAGLFQNTRFHVGMADGAQVDRVRLAQVGQDGIRQNFAGLFVALAAQVVGNPLKESPDFWPRDLSQPAR